jgi:hypothetical protein
VAERTVCFWECGPQLWASAMGANQNKLVRSAMTVFEPQTAGMPTGGLFCHFPGVNSFRSRSSFRADILLVDDK